MNNRKETPKELLKREKALLEKKSERLVVSIEDTLEYSRDNIGAIIGQTALESVIPMLPPFVQRILRGGECTSTKRYREEPTFLSFASLTGIVAELLPFFLKGKKGIILSYVLKKLRRFF